jgi:stearoyl-CoA desaturase (delta-9 desaturase)
MKNILQSSTTGAQIFFLFSLVSSIIGLYHFGLDTQSLLIILLGYFSYGCLGVVVTFHRQLTHKSYATNTLISRLFSLLGCLGGTGSSLAWVAIHINHHLKSDKASDPHSPYHKGWKIFFLNYENEVDLSTKWRMKHLITDKFHQILHRYYFGILLMWSLILIAAGGIYLALFLHWIPALVTAIMSNVVNYIGHKPTWVGSFRRYNLNDCSANNWVWAIPTWGESWHNNHHRHPKNYSCGEKWWEIDISSYVIQLIKK